jgi:spore maturation protein CgeB
MAAWYGGRTDRSFDTLAPGCDPSVHRPMRVRETPLKSNVTFVGEATPWREGMLAELVDFGLTVWGAGWRSTVLRDYCLDERLSNADANRAIAGSTVAVTLQREAPGQDGPPRTVTARLFETAAMGVPQVVDLTDDLAEHFTPGSEVLTVDDPAALRSAVKQVLYHHAERDTRAAAARRRALGSHTYMHRMREVVTTGTA